MQWAFPMLCVASFCKFRSEKTEEYLDKRHSLEPKLIAHLNSVNNTHIKTSVETYWDSTE